MNKRAFSLLLVIALLLSACAVGYQARGSLSDIPGELRGKAYPGSVTGGGRFALSDRQGRLQCDGRMSPPDSSPLPGRCEGESGAGVLRCSDGREVSVRWTALTCRSFEGRGEDQLGNRLIFRVDRNN